MQSLRRGLVVCLALVGMAAGARAQSGQLVPAAAEQLLALANRTRAGAGAGRLQWDPALAEAARQHCLRMAEEGPIAHRYGGEPSVEERAANAGARFALIEENVAVGPTAAVIHDEWMHSQGHRENLLNPQVNRVGIAVVATRGVLYAVADYARDVPSLSQSQVEARVAALMRPSGVSVLRDPSLARAACVTDRGLPASRGGLQPRFIMRWQDAQLSQLPQALADKLATGRYRQAEVGSCRTSSSVGSFSAFRIAVILF